MAFNPFTWFRKHQRMLIAIVTIFVMFIFILQFGKGDIFERQWFRTERGEVVATINGTKFRETEVDRVAKKRKMASDFLLVNAALQHEKVLKELLDTELKSSSKANPFLDPYARLRRICQNAQERPRKANLTLMQAINDVLSDLQTLEQLGSDEKFAKESENLTRLQKVGAILGFQLWGLELQLTRRTGANAADELYFGGNAKKLEDTLDFIMWRQQAEKLGISLVDADVAREINREAAGREVFADLDKVNLEKDKTVSDFAARREYFPLTAKDLAEALRDEFRVAMAQGVLLGAEPGARAYRSFLGGVTTPAAGTPEEFLTFYRERRTRLTVEFLAVPAEKFLDKVTESPPSRGQLLARYEKFKDQEPDPASRDPGFKVPRQILVQYVTGDSGHKFYRDQAKEHASFHARLVAAYRGRGGDATSARASAAAGLLGMAAQGTLTSLLSLPALAIDNPLAEDYESYVNDHSPWLPPSRDLTDITEFERARRSRMLRPSSTLDPQVLASAIGNSTAGPLHGLCGLAQTAQVIETREAVRQVGGVLLASGDPQNLFGAAGLALAAQPRPLPYERVEPRLVAQLEERLAPELLLRGLTAFSRRLDELKKQPEKAEELIAKTLKENPTLKLASMTKPLSLEALAVGLERKEDLKLDALREPLLRQATRQLAQAEQFAAIAPQFAQQRDALRAALARPDRGMAAMLFQGKGTYEARVLGDESARTAVAWWRKEEHDAKRLDFAEVEQEVLRSWKMDHARVLARQEAEKLEAEINKAKWSPADAERFLREKQAAGLGPLFELEDVSQLVVPPQPVMPLREEYRPYLVPSDKLAMMPYAPADLARQLMTLERPGSAKVIEDAPQTTFYVAVLKVRDEPTVRQFREVYSRISTADPLYLMFVRQKADEYRRTVTEAMRRQAGKVGKDGRFEIPESLRKRDSRVEQDVE